MNIFHKIRLFLVIFLILGFCVSCGGKKSVPEEPQKKPKKKREKVVPPPEEEVLPVKEEIPPLSEDVSTWKKEDFVRARQENHKSLMDACMLLGKTQATKEANQKAIEILLAVLKPVDPPEMEKLVEPEVSEDSDDQEARDKQREYEDKLREQEKILNDLPKLDSRKIEYVIEQIALIGTSDAWDALLNIWQQKIKTDDDSNIDQTVLKTILGHPQTNNKDIVFNLIVHPESLVVAKIDEEAADETASRKFDDPDADKRNRNRNERERRVLEPEKVFDEAMKWAEKYADKEFRVKLAKYLVDGTNKELSESRTNKIVEFLMAKNLDNFSAQLLFYPDFLSETELQGFNAFIEKCSAPAYAAWTDQCSVNPETLFAADKKASGEGQSESGRRRRTRAEAKDNTESEAPSATETQKEKESGAADGENGLGVADEEKIDSKTTDIKNDEIDKPEATDKIDKTDAADASKGEPEESFAALQPYEPIVINESVPQLTMMTHPEFALQVLQLIWSKDYIDNQRQLFEKSLETESSSLSQISAFSFLLALPFKGEQSYWFDFFNDRWDAGPGPFDRSAFFAPEPINPGVLLSVKQLKRSAAPDKKSVKKNSQSKDKLSAREQAQQTSIAWMSFTKEMVTAEMGRLLRAAAYQKFTQRDVSKLKKVMPFKIPEGAIIEAEYHFLLPYRNTSMKKDGSWEFDPLEVHFVRIKWNVRQIEIAKRIKYKDDVSLTMRNCPETKNVWLELFKESDTMLESMDVIINDVEAYEPTQADDFVVDILTLRSKKSVE